MGNASSSKPLASVTKCPERSALGKGCPQAGGPPFELGVSITCRFSHHRAANAAKGASSTRLPSAISPGAAAGEEHVFLSLRTGAPIMTARREVRIQCPRYDDQVERPLRPLRARRGMTSARETSIGHPPAVN